MDTASVRQPAAAESPERITDATLIRRLAGELWHNLALLLALNAVFVIAAIPTGIAAMIWLPSAPAVAMVTLGPVWATMTAVTDQLTAGRVRKIRDLPGLFRRHGLTGIATALPLGLIATGLLLTLTSYSVMSTWTGLGVAAVLAVAMIFVAVLTPPAFCVATTAGVRGWRRWRAAAAVAGARPLFTLGSVALVVVLGVLLDSLGVGVRMGILVLLPAPLAMYASAITWHLIESTTFGPRQRISTPTEVNVNRGEQ